MATSGSRKISGVYPHLTTYSQSRKDGKFFKAGHEECGIGAVIPWANKLWMVTYAPHMPKGSDHKLYSIDKDMNMTIHAESVGGTPAARMIHQESQQLFIAHHAIDKAGKSIAARIAMIAMTTRSSMSVKRWTGVFMASKCHESRRMHSPRFPAMTQTLPRRVAFHVYSLTMISKWLPENVPWPG